LKIAAVLWVFLLAAAAWCGRQIARGKRHRSKPRTRRVLLILAPPVLVMLIWWYLFYAPESLPLPIGPSFLSLWPLPLIHYVTALFLGWMAVALLFALFPPRHAEPS
jgi:hypothetical protein